MTTNMINNTRYHQQQQHQQQHQHQSCSFATTSNGSNRKQRRNPPKRITKSEKKIAHIKRSMKHRASLQKSHKNKEIMEDIISTVKQPLQPITDVIYNEKFQSQVMDKLSSFQKRTQNFFLPESMLHSRSRPSREQRIQNSVVMDQKWWTWNIALACLPAFLIACLCEYQKPEMEIYYKRVNQNINKDGTPKVNGIATTSNSATDTDTDTEGTSAQGSNILLNSLKNALTDDRGSFDKIVDSFKSILGVSASIPNNQDDESQIDTTIEKTIEKTITMKNENNHDTIQNRKTTLKDDVDVTSTTTSQVGKDHKIEELLSRIKTLEQKLGVVAVEIEYPSSEKKDKDNNTIANLVPTEKKSNLRKRVENRKKEQQQQYQQQQQKLEEKTDMTKQIQSQKSFFPIYALQRNFELKVDKVKNEIYGVLGMNNDNNKSKDSDNHNDNHHITISSKDDKNQEVQLKGINDKDSIVTVTRNIDKSNEFKKDDMVLVQTKTETITTEGNAAIEEDQREIKLEKKKNGIWKWVKLRFSRGKVDNQIQEDDVDNH